ncbi:GNAT family N-acetyltransferase [Actinoplanes sp. NPDC026623]|uniref:GNAT family N-acetyltransferase n=1 Tax=Actinoplanes sp. NPDC026623 TaxID=3155610 RepID=UPI0033C20289
MFPQGRYPSTGIGGGVFAHRGLGAAAEVEARTARYGQNRFAAGKVELETGILLTLFNAVLGLQQEGKAAAAVAESALTGESLPVSKGTEAVAGGALVAMADERLHPPGWTEISAVCTDPAHRGQGLATRLVRAVAGIRARGEIPFLHTSTRGLRSARLHPGPRADPATDRTTRRRSGPSRSPPTRTTSPWSGETESTDPIDRLSGEQAETARVRVV